MNTKTQNVASGLAWAFGALGHALVSLSLGVVLVVSILPFNLLVGIVWLICVTVAWRRQHAIRQSRRAWFVVAIQVAEMAAVIAGAHFAPVKKTERFLASTIALPESEMTLGELAGDSVEPDPEWRPFSVSLSVPADERSRRVAFPGRTISLRQFVDAIEAQTPLRHRFSHCGNGWTVLWGGDCSFGLCVRDPARPYE